MADELCPGCDAPDPGIRHGDLGPDCYTQLLASASRVHFDVGGVTGRRFVQHVDMGGALPDHADVEGPCWAWTGATNDSGYGVFRSGPDRVVYAHIWAAEQAYGAAPPGFQWDHACHHREHCAGGPKDPHRSCVNPAHLRLRTSRQNTLDGAGPTAENARKTHCNDQHELTPANVYTPPRDPHERQCRLCRAAAGRRRRALYAARAHADAAAAVARIGAREVPREAASR